MFFSFTAIFMPNFEIYFNFKNLIANLIFIISGFLSIWFLTGVISTVNSYIEITETTEYNLPVTNDMFDNILTFLYLIQIIIVGLILYSGFKTIRNYKQIE